MHVPRLCENNQICVWFCHPSFDICANVSCQWQDCRLIVALVAIVPELAKSLLTLSLQFLVVTRTY